jgi:hypothetical protein
MASQRNRYCSKYIYLTAMWKSSNKPIEMAVLKKKGPGFPRPWLIFGG